MDTLMKTSKMLLQFESWKNDYFLRHQWVLWLYHSLSCDRCISSFQQCNGHQLQLMVHATGNNSVTCISMGNLVALAGEYHSLDPSLLHGYIPPSRNPCKWAYHTHILQFSFSFLLTFHHACIAFSQNITSYSPERVTICTYAIVVALPHWLWQ